MRYVQVRSPAAMWASRVTLAPSTSRHSSSSERQAPRGPRGTPRVGPVRPAPRGGPPPRAGGEGGAVEPPVGQAPADLLALAAPSLGEDGLDERLVTDRFERLEQPVREIRVVRREERLRRLVQVGAMARAAPAVALRRGGHQAGRVPRRQLRFHPAGAWIRAYQGGSDGHLLAYLGSYASDRWGRRPPPTKRRTT